MRTCVTGMTAALLFVHLAGTAGADLIRLHSGGEVRGTLRPGHTRDPQVTIDTLTGGIVVVDREEVEFSTVRRIEVEEYEIRAREVANTVEARWDLAEWCRQNRLRSERDEQLEQILLIDPDHAAAHKALGHVEERGVWMTKEEHMASRGYFLHQGKYVTQQELDLIEKSSAERAAEREWFTRTYAWVRWLTGTNERQRQQGLSFLREITDPAAVAALSNHMSDHELVGVRRLFIEIISGIPGPKPVPALVNRSLFDPDVGLREAARNGISKDQTDAAVAAYAPALRNSDNRVVNRAGAALGDLGDVRIVPALIDALVTQHRYEVQVPVNNNIGVVAGPNGTAWADPSIVSQYLPLDVEIALRTGQLPFGVKVIPPPGTQTRYRTVRVHMQMQNAEVLAALEALTGENFGYDERTWKLWWAAEGQTVLSRVS